ncbi:unnamed protein product [Paramecium sonneborni]|uniref:Uncharacterized protein n=1 Tax=Paramecium sonneborni TaxID=65129 RepID=A0A8S1R2T5_9CILI|nr:unnamed protein product [Paramecium sonneborni]
MMKYIKIHLEIQLEMNECFRKFLLFQQTIFDKDKLKCFTEEETFHQIQALQIIFNNNNLFNEYILENSDQGDFYDKRYISFLRELQKNFQNSEENEILEIFQDSSYKVRESLAFNLIKLQSVVHEDKIQEFCSNLLKQLWMIEKQTSVRKIFKNKEMIEMEKKLFSRNFSTFSNQLKTEMQKRLKKLEQLETLVLLSNNQTETKNQLQQASDDFEIYLDNITKMSHKMDISFIFNRNKQRFENNKKINFNQFLQSVKGIEDDVRKLRGKDYFELLLICKDKELKFKQQAELEYDPSSGQKIENTNGAVFSDIIKNNHNDFEGEINEFIWKEEEKNKDVMLLKWQGRFWEEQSFKEY